MNYYDAYTFVINYLLEIEIEFNQINFIFVTLVKNKESQYKIKEYFSFALYLIIYHISNSFIFAVIFHF